MQKYTEVYFIALKVCTAICGHANAKRKEWIDKNIEKVRASKRKYEEKKKHERKIQKLDNMIRG